MSDGERVALPDLEEVFQAFPYALFILVAGDSKASTGIVATWSMQVSFQPPLVAAAVETRSIVLPSLKASGMFSLNFLGSGERDVAAGFLKPAGAAEGRMAGHDLEFRAGGIPYLVDAAAVLACRLRAMHDAGDHVLCVGEVVDAVVRRRGGVLKLSDTGWKYFRKPL